MKYKNNFPRNRKHGYPTLEALAAKETARKERIELALKQYRQYIDVHPDVPEERFLFPKERELKEKEEKFRDGFTDDVVGYHNTHPNYTGQVIHEIGDPALEGIISKMGGLATRAINAGEPNVKLIHTLDHVNRMQEPIAGQGNQAS